MRGVQEGAIPNGGVFSAQHNADAGRVSGDEGILPQLSVMKCGLRQLPEAFDSKTTQKISVVYSLFPWGVV